MSDTVGSITRLLPQLRDRNELAVEAIWRRYVGRVHGAARPVIAGLGPGVGDEEDVAQSAFHAFYEAAANERLPPLGSRDELWRLLLTITRRKAIDRLRREYRLRRGGRVRTIHDAEAVNQACDGGEVSIDLTELQESLDDLMHRLAATGDARLATVARLRLEGRSNQEIADTLGCAARTIQRKLHILERLWTEQS
ncbi:MAG TPA: ECF-type sigma factor [Lacipirellulaceae bacterium]|jgi:RNA polymerase sigma factor (sigma-70 family)|nr:ECF-type sigma factor [Lacipirellulaceae bacterium]